MNAASVTKETIRDAAEAFRETKETIPGIMMVLLLANIIFVRLPATTSGASQEPPDGQFIQVRRRSGTIGRHDEVSGQRCIGYGPRRERKADQVSALRHLRYRNARRLYGKGRRRSAFPVHRFLFRFRPHCGLMQPCALLMRRLCGWARIHCGPTCRLCGCAPRGDYHLSSGFSPLYTLLGTHSIKSGPKLAGPLSSDFIRM